VKLESWLLWEGVESREAFPFKRKGNAGSQKTCLQKKTPLLRGKEGVIFY